MPVLTSGRILWKLLFAGSEMWKTFQKLFIAWMQNVWTEGRNTFKMAIVWLQRCKTFLGVSTEWLYRCKTLNIVSFAWLQRRKTCHSVFVA
jgi:hypothetical protein